MDEQIILIGRDYLSCISAENIAVSSSKKDRVIFKNKELANLYVPIIKYFTSEEIKIVSKEEDDLKTWLSGLSLEECLKKTKPIIVERGKELFDKGSVLSITKQYQIGEIIYSCLVKSSNDYDKYNIKIKVDKDKKFISATCSCPYGEAHEQSLCKHSVACIYAILDY